MPCVSGSCGLKMQDVRKACLNTFYRVLIFI